MKSPLDWFNNLNLKTPVKQTVIAGIFLLLATVTGGAFSLLIANAQKTPLSKQTLTHVSQASEPKVSNNATQSVQQVSPFEFTEAVIDSLSLAAEARHILVTTESTGGGTAADTLNSMTNARLAINKLEEANRRVQRFSGTQNETITLSVGLFKVAYAQLIESLNAIIKSEEQLMGVADKQELAGVLSEASKWLAQADEAWKMLVYATIGATYVLANNQRLQDGKLPYLTITPAERQKLLDKLESFFGESVKKGMVAGQYGTEAAPAALWQFLNRPWKTSDEP